MAKRIVLYVGTIVVALALWVLLSDRLLTDPVPPLENRFLRFAVLLVVMFALGRAARPLFRPRSS
jgi:hypothetical protein